MTLAALLAPLLRSEANPDPLVNNGRFKADFSRARILPRALNVSHGKGPVAYSDYWGGPFPVAPLSGKTPVSPINSSFSTWIQQC